MALWSLLRVTSQRSLRSCRLEFEDRPLERASLFPLFDEQGKTQVVMITAEESGRILLADWAPGLFMRDWRRNRLRLRYADLNDASTWNEERFEDLWHFDPWWVLNDERYQSHGAVPALRRTNIPGYDATVSEIAFDSRLERAAYVMKRSGQSRVKRFTSDTLSSITGRRRAALERPRGAGVAGWRLRAFWRSP